MFQYECFILSIHGEARFSWIINNTYKHVLHHRPSTVFLVLSLATNVTFFFSENSNSISFPWSFFASRVCGKIIRCFISRPSSYYPR
jgi:hypothetical protein